MAQRMVRRAGITGEDGVAVSFGFKSLAAAVLISVLEELPYLGLAATLLTFPLHRFVLVTDRNVYVFKGRPFHQPGETLGKYPRGPGIVSRVRGKLTFSDGTVVWHSPLISWRAKAVAEAATAGSVPGEAAPVSA